MLLTFLQLDMCALAGVLSLMFIVRQNELELDEAERDAS